MGSDREQRAIDALIVSQIRSCDERDPDSLPALNDEELGAIESLGEDFIDRLLAGEVTEGLETFCESRELAAAGEAFGMNRAKGINSQSKEELDRKRQEIIDRIRQLEQEHGESGG